MPRLLFEFYCFVLSPNIHDCKRITSACNNAGVIHIRVLTIISHTTSGIISTLQFPRFRCGNRKPFQALCGENIQELWNAILVWVYLCDFHFGSCIRYCEKSVSIGNWNGINECIIMRCVVYGDIVNITIYFPIPRVKKRRHNYNRHRHCKGH